MKNITVFIHYSNLIKLIFALIIQIVFVSILTGCASTEKKTFNEESYILGNTKTVNQGDIIASELQGEVETKRKWVGIFNSKDGWGPARLKYSDDYVEKKLYYVGFNNSYIHLMYREYRQGEDQPFVNKTKEFDPEIDPFIELGIFKIKVLSAGGLQASFLLFDKQSWSKEKQFYLIAKEKKEKEDELDRIIHATKLLRDESQAAKNYAESFVNITPTFETFSQAAYEFDELSSTFNGVKMNNYSIDQLIEIYQTLENQFSQSAQYFTTLQWP